MPTYCGDKKLFLCLPDSMGGGEGEFFLRGNAHNNHVVYVVAIIIATFDPTLVLSSVQMSVGKILSRYKFGRGQM